MKYFLRWVTTWLLVLGIAAATRCDVLLGDELVCSDRLVSQEPVATGFIETWEGAATSRLPEGPWQLAGGVWGAVAQQDANGAGRKYAVAPGQVSQLRRAVSFAGQDHVVVEGWLHDPGPDTHSMLGLASSKMVEDAATVRIEAAGQGTYRVQYFEWSEKTNYPATALALNPFLASIANQTFNTGTEAVRSFHEDFAQDPLTRGWYFDFSFMAIGRRRAPDEGPPQMAMTTDAVAYAWSPADRAVQVRGHWTRGEFGELEGLVVPQRRRYVRPITPLTRSDDIRMEMDFTIEDFGRDTTNPILLGLFHCEAAADAQTLCVRMASDRDIALSIAGDGLPWSLPLAPAAPLLVGRAYRLMVTYHAATRRVSGTLVDRSIHAEVCRATATLPATVGPFVLDEAGVAQREEAFAATAAGSYRFRLEGFQLHPPQPAAADN